MTETGWVGRPLSSLHLVREGVVVLGIQRDHGDYLGVPHGTTHIDAGDTVVAYGPMSVLAELDERVSGREGDRAHLHAVASHERAVQQADGVVVAEAVSG